MTTPLTAKSFIETLIAKKSATEAKKNARFFRNDQHPGNQFLGIRMKTLFDTSKEFMAMPLLEVEKLMESKFYEIRMGAVCIMDFQAREKKITEAEKKKLFELYIKRHDRIDNWDMVDRSAPWVVGGYLADKPRTILYKLAKSKNVWERRTAIVSTWFFIRKNDVKDTFKIAEMLLKDKHDLIQKAVGGWIREAGKRDKEQLLRFLDKHAMVMPREMLTNAIEKLDKQQKELYRSKKMIQPAK